MTDAPAFDEDLLDPAVEARELFRFLRHVQLRKLPETVANLGDLQNGENGEGKRRKVERLLANLDDLQNVVVDELERVELLSGAPTGNEVRLTVQAGDGSDDPELTEPIPLRLYTMVRGEDGRPHALYVLGWSGKYGVVCEVS